MEANIPKMIPNNKWGQEYSIKDLNLKPAVFLEDNMTCKDAINHIKQSSYDQFPVKSHEDGKLLGMVTSTLLMEKLANKKIQLEDLISKVMTKEFRNMSSQMPLSELSRVLERQNFVFVDGSHIVSSYDLLEFMSQSM